MTMQVQNNLIRFKSAEPVNFNTRTVTPMPTNYGYDDDVYVSQSMALSKAEKRERSRDNWNKAGVIASFTIAGSMLLATLGAAGVLAGLGLKGKNAEAKKAAVRAYDVTNEKTFEQLTLSKEMKKAVEDMKMMIDHADMLKKKGGTGGTGIMLYGEPGGGKNAYVYALTKYLKEKHPGSELIMMDVLKFKDKHVGETENNIIDFVENVIKQAKQNPDKRYIVFLDEFDSIARKDPTSSNKALQESFQNAFKTTLVKLTGEPNIQVIAATNKAAKNESLNKLLDDAILNRFPKKIYVPLPTKEQFHDAIIEHYKNLPSEYVDEKLTKSSSELKSLCSYIAKKNHHASFRDMEYILAEARIISEKRSSGSKITMKDLKQAVKEHAKSENWEKGRPSYYTREFPEERTSERRTFREWLHDIRFAIFGR